MGILSKLFGKYLLLTNTVSCGLMMGFGDILQQRSEHWKRNDSQNTDKDHNKKKPPTSADIENVDEEYEHDYIRTKNMLIVGVVQGPFHHYFYAILDRTLPGKDATSLVKKTLLDQFVASPTCLAIFFFGHGALEHRKIEDIHNEVKLKFMDTWKVDWCFWPPVQFVNFLFVPIRYRVLYINLMTMIYDIYLSYIKYDAQYD